MDLVRMHSSPHLTNFPCPSISHCPVLQILRYISASPPGLAVAMMGTVPPQCADVYARVAVALPPHTHLLLDGYKGTSELLATRRVTVR